MTMEFFEAAEIQAIADDLIAEYHKPLTLAHIRCLFTTKAKKVDGVDLIAWTKKLDPLAAWTRLKDPNKRRIIHHEIMRMCGGPGKWALVDHDFDGFFAELKLYGPWHDRLRWMANTIEQLHLPVES
jgi:hypothetical protein